MSAKVHYLPVRPGVQERAYKIATPPPSGFKRDEPHWHCDCGHDLFHLTPQGPYCPKCGAQQEL